MVLNLAGFTGIFILIFLIWLVVLSIILYRLSLHYRRLMRGASKKDLRSILEKLLKSSEIEKKRVEVILKQIKRLEKDGSFHFQKFGLIRFNPFAETGGDQSFCLALLDGKKNGLVISSLHSRETTRIYAKPVKSGKKVGYALSEEEEKAVSQAK